MAKEVLNLRADAMATSAYYVVETMGRKAGWLSYGVAIAGEASLVVGVEDLGPYLEAREDGTTALSLDSLSSYLVDVMLERERQGKHHGVIVLAEGLAERREGLSRPQECVVHRWPGTFVPYHDPCQ